MATGSYYSEPNYLNQQATTELLSDTRSISLSTHSLSFLNNLIDELLHLTIHNSLLSSSNLNSNLGLQPIILNPQEVLTNNQIKLGFLRVLGNSNLLGKGAILEAEIAIRTLLSLSKSTSLLQNDPCLGYSTTSTGGGVQQELQLEQADTLFRSLRSSVSSMSSFSTLYQPTSGQRGPSLTRHLTLLSPFPANGQIKSNQATTSSNSPQIRFLNSFYTERILSYIIENLLRCLIRYLDSEEVSSGIGGGGEERVVELEELEAAFEEEEVIWSWLSRMRCRSMFDDLRSNRITSSSNGHNNYGNGNGSISAGNSRNKNRNVISNGMVQFGHGTSDSIDSIGSVTALLYGSTGMSRKKSEDGFESVMTNNKTRKVSLTPNRLRATDKFTNARSSSIPSSSQTSYPLAQIPSSNSLPNLSSTPPLPSIPSSHSLDSFPTTKARRLQPRTPKAHQIEEEEEEDDEDEEVLNYNSGSGGGERKKLRAKESLLDMLSSEPPSSWKGDRETSTITPIPKSIASKMMRSRSNSISKEKENNGSTVRSRETSPTRLRKLSLKRKGSISSSSTTALLTPTTPPQHDKPYLSSPQSTPMRSSGSNSSVQSYRSGVSYDSNLSSPAGGGPNSDEEVLTTPSRSSRNKSIAEDSIIGSIPGSRAGRRLEAKDEKSDISSTKRANDDLLAFLNSPPPKNLPVSDPFRSDEEVMNASGMNGFSSLRKKGIRSFMSKLGGGSGKKEDSNDHSSDGNNSSASRASSTIIRSLGRKTTRVGTNDDSTQFSTNPISSPRLLNSRSAINSDTYNSSSISSSQSTPQLIIETTPPSPITNQFSIPNSQPPAYSVPSYSRPSPLAPTTNGNINTNTKNLSSPSSRAMEYSKSLESTPTSTVKASDPYQLVSNDRSLAEDGLSTMSKRAGLVRSLSVGSLDTGITTSTSTSIILPTEIPSTPVTPTTTAIINDNKSTAVIIPGGGSPRSSSSLSRNRRDSISSSIGSTTTGGSAFNSQTNFKPVPLHILTSNIFSPASTSTVTTPANSETASNSTTMNTITKRDIATSPNNPIITSNPFTTSSSTIVAVASGAGIVTTASVVRLARSSSTRVKVPKVEGGSSTSRDGSPSPTTGTLPYLISKPDEERSVGEVKGEEITEDKREEQKENQENFPISTNATKSTDSSTLLLITGPVSPITILDIIPTDSNKEPIDESSKSPDRALQIILVELKQKMESASSTTECLALIDQLLQTPANKGNSHRSRLPLGIPVLAAEKNSVESEMLMVEYLLGGSDFSAKKADTKLAIHQEEDSRGIQKEEKEIAEEQGGEDEGEDDEEIEFKMPGAM